MEKLEKTLQKIQFRTLPNEETKLNLGILPSPLPLTPHIKGLKEDIMKSFVVKFFTDKVIGPKITAGETFTLKVKMRVINPQVAFKNVSVRILPNFEFVSMEESWYGTYAFFDEFGYADGWIYTDLKLKARVDNIPVDAIYDIAEIKVDADLNYETLFHIKTKIEEVEVLIQS